VPFEELYTEPIHAVKLWHRRRIRLGLPEKLYLDITEDCNLHCLVCRSEIKADGKTLSTELFESLAKPEL